MGIKVNASFSYGAAVPVDDRLVLTKAQMLLVDDNVWPDLYPTWCPDDGIQYLYNKTNTMDPETGKFRAVKSGVMTATVTSTTTDEDFNALLAETLIQITVNSLNTSADWATDFNPAGAELSESDESYIILKLADELHYTYITRDGASSASMTSIWAQQKNGSTYEPAVKLYPASITVSEMPIVTASDIAANRVLIYNGTDQTTYKYGHTYRLGKAFVPTDNNWIGFVDQADAFTIVVAQAEGNDWSNVNVGDKVYVKYGSVTYAIEDVLIEVDGNIVPSTLTTFVPYSSTTVSSLEYYYWQDTLEGLEPGEFIQVWHTEDVRLAQAEDLEKKHAIFYADTVIHSAVGIDEGYAHYKPDFIDETRPDTFKYVGSTGTKNFAYSESSLSGIRAGNAVYLEIDTDKWVRDILVADGSSLYPSAYKGNADWEITSSITLTEETVSGQVLSWVKCYDLDLKQNKIQFEVLPNAYELVQLNPLIVQYVGNDSRFAKAHFYVPSTQTAANFYGWKNASDEVVYTDTLDASTSSFVYAEDHSFFTKTGLVISATTATTITISGVEYTRYATADATDQQYYDYADISPDNFQFTVMPNATEFANKVIQYIGETTVAPAPVYVKGHFYQSIETATTGVYAWTDLDTEMDDYDNIENRPLILHRSETIFSEEVTGYNDEHDVYEEEVTLASPLVENKNYVVTIDGVEYLGTCVAGTDTLEIAFTDVTQGEVKFTYDTVNDTTTMLLPIDADWLTTPPTISLATEQTVEVNPDYADFFNQMGAETVLAENVTSNVDCGALPANSTLNQGTTFTDVMKALLIKYFEPTIAMTSDKTLLNEIGTTVSQPIGITATFVEKSRPITHTEIKDPQGTVLAERDNSSQALTASYTTDITEDTIFTGSVSDGKTTVPASLKFEFVLPYYIGNLDHNTVVAADLATIAAQTGGNQGKIIQTKKTTQEARYPNGISAKYLVVAYNSSYNDVKTIKDQNDFDNTSSWTKSTLTVEIDSVEYTYNVYVSNTPITVRDEAAGYYKYTFNF